jgi:succinate dehydrogenase / fumarate reductase flavoprotein subunit
MANPCYTQIHPTCIPVSGDYQSKLTLMSESLRNDGRIWVPKKRRGLQEGPRLHPRGRSRLLPRAHLPELTATWPRATSPPRRQTHVCDEGRGVGETGLGVYLDFSDAIKRLTEAGVRERYGNLFDIYHEITNENAYKTPMRIFPAVHYTMGGLWVDYNLMSNVPGLFVLGEANFSDHGANRLGASALMQGLADGYFVIPYTIGDYLAQQKPGSKPSTDAPEFKQAEENVVRHRQAADVRQGQGTREPLPQAARPAHVDPLRHGPHQGRPRSQGAAGDSEAARGVLGQRQCPRRRPTT